ncbi:hypothetical protein F2P81_022802 [Scophthalmus maximus]|uniref:Uncharacterized protein n=1 Tax=Scophthalmus maximus TaxID=52904 RepID=A0A6A4S413_SCOMX|nr:hypothetical protein F2P81_022802 [Scophthalmus maximus]
MDSNLICSELMHFPFQPLCRRASPSIPRQKQNPLSSERRPFKNPAPCSHRRPNAPHAPQTSAQKSRSSASRRKKKSCRDDMNGGTMAMHVPFPPPLGASTRRTRGIHRLRQLRDAVKGEITMRAHVSARLQVLSSVMQKQKKHDRESDEFVSDFLPDGERRRPLT